ncbi:unnamed protein product [Calypogeia fissa]
MSGRATVRLILIIACTLTTLSDCARPLQDDELSTVILRLLETSQQISNLPPLQLSPAHRSESMFNVQRKPPSPIEEYKGESISQSSEESLKTRSLVEFDRITLEQHRKYTYSSMLHKNPAGPNPIGNEYGPSDTIHTVKKYRYPPPQG